MGKGTMILRRKLGEIAYAANSEKNLEIKVKPNLIKRLNLRLTLTNTVAGAGGNAVQDNPLSLIENIRIEAPGRTFKNFDPRMMHFINHLELGAIPKIIGQLSGAVADGTYAQEVNMMIPFESIRSLLPETTVLNSNSHSSITVIVKWKDDNDIVDANNTLSLVNIEVMSYEREPKSSEDQTLKRPELLDSQLIQTVAAVNTALQVDLIEDTKIKSILLMAIKAGVRDDGLINNVRVIGDNDGRVLRNLPFAEIQSQNKEDFGIETLQTGIALIEFDPDGDLAELLDTIDLNNPKLEFDVDAPSGVTQIYVLQRQLIG